MVQLTVMVALNESRSLNPDSLVKSKCLLIENSTYIQPPLKSFGCEPQFSTFIHNATIDIYMTDGQSD